MSNIATDDSDDELSRGHSLHLQFLHGDSTAFARIAEQYLEPLTAGLKRRYPALDPHWIESAVDDALLAYYRNPEKFDASKRSLKGYLYMSANGDLINTIEREKFPQTLVELDASVTEYKVEIPDDEEWQERIFARLSPVWERVRKVLDDPLDEEIVTLMLDGERNTLEYARVLGITERPVHEQERIVKQHKERLKKFLRRHLDSSEFREHE